MTRNEAIQNARWQLERYVNSITEKSKGANMYVCPLCHSGHKKNATGAFSVQGDHWKCFSCGKGGDIFDLVGEMYGLAEFNDQVEEVFDLLDFDEIEARKVKAKPAPERKELVKQSKPEKQEVDFTDFYIQANKDLNKTDYHRGISLEVLNRFQVGYVQNWKHPLSPRKPATPRLIIPTSNTSYIARYASNDLPEGEKKVMKVGKSKLFNPIALIQASGTNKPVIIVEGEIDALSVIEAGASAVGLGGTGNVEQLLELVKEMKNVPFLILSLDNDEKGQEAQEKLKKGLQSLMLDFYEYNIAGEEKDANGALLRDREGFIARVKDAEEREEEVRRAKKEAYMLTSAGGRINDFVKGIVENASKPCISTGFSRLDKILDGGLYEGLYVIGALSGAGKTSFVLQMADQIAQNDQNILYFSLEMASYELMAKSISRHTLEIVEREDLPAMYAKTARGVSSGVRYTSYDQTQKDVINQAIQEYGYYADHIWFKEGIGNIGVAQIRKALDKHINMTGSTPVVIVDYMQILSPADPRATDKQNTDKAILELKRISRDFKTPVIAISSLNRASYQNDISMEAFKESGAIEYSCDVLIGLQKKKDGNNDDGLKEMQLHVLKNRYGTTTGMEEYQEKPIGIKFYPKYNLFEEMYKD